MKLLTKANNIFDRAIQLLFGFAQFLIVFGALVILTGIVARMVGKPIEGTIDLVEYTLLQITFWGAVWVQKRGGHIKVDLLFNYLKPVPKTVVNIITSITCAMLFLTLAWYGAHAVWTSYQLGYRTFAILTVPKFILLLVIPAGSCLLCIQFLRQAYQYSKEWKILPDKEQNPAWADTDRQES